MWIKIRFNTNHEFCKSPYSVTYDGFQLEIQSGHRNDIHSLFIKIPTKSCVSAYESALGFLSELSWLFQTKIEISQIEQLEQRSKGPFGVYLTEEHERIPKVIDLDGYNQIATDYEQKLALGIYREGISSNSTFYSFISYFRIINIKCGTRIEHEDWINNNIHKVYNNSNLIIKLKNEGIPNIGNYFYKSGRCALAHANIERGEPIADANSYNDNDRISNELPLIKELAEIFMREELNIPPFKQKIQTTT